MKKQMMKFQSLAFTILSCGILISDFEIPKAMPRKLLKGIKLTSMSTSLSTSSSTSISRTSSTLMTQTDGALPQNSNLQTVFSSVQEASGGSDPVVKPKTYASFFPKSSSLVSQFSSLQISETDSTIPVSKNPTSGITENLKPGGGKQKAPRSKWKAYPEQLNPGDAIYKPTFQDGDRKQDVSPRPHLVLKVELISSNETSITMVDMSRAEGKGEKVYHKNNYLLDQSDPNFSGRNSTFVKLNKVRTIILKNSDRTNLLGKEVNPRDLKEILKRTGIE